MTTATAYNSDIEKNDISDRNKTFPFELKKINKQLANGEVKEEQPQQ